MISFFDRIYPDTRSVSPSEIQFTLKLFQQDLKTVLVDISFGPEDKMILLINDGKIISAYLINRDQISRAPTTNLMDLLSDRSQGTIRVCELAPSFLGALKTILEQKTSSHTLDSNTAALSGLIQQWQTASEPSLVHIRWATAEGFVFIPGNHFPARQYVFLADGNPIDSAAAVSVFSRWAEPECQIAQYISDPEIEIWQENNLRMGFALLTEQVMRRYEELVGTMLSRKLEDSLNRLHHAQSWNISFGDNTVDDVQFFDSVDAAAAAYRSIFNLASRQISQVIGASLFNQAVDSGLNSLGNQLRQGIEENNIAGVLSASLVRA